MPAYDIITFDCYGTLIDWQRGIARAFLAEAEAAGYAERRAEPERACIYHEVELNVQAEAFRSYRAVLAETATRVAELLGWDMEPAAAERLAASVPAWPPFADTADATLQRLAAAGYALGIL
ncbi:MAG: hypothetical protein U0074_05400 [Kouleothrix sp.]